MKLIGFDDKKQEKRTDTFSQALSSVRLPFPRKAPSAEEVVIDILKKVLDNRYFLLRDTLLDGLDVPIPFILVGSAGIWVIYPVSSKGICRAEESNWEVMDERTKRYRPGRPNLLVIADSMAKAVEKHLISHQLRIPLIEPLIIFTNPGVHLEMSRPLVRIVQIDGLSRFAAGLLQNDSILNPREIQLTIDALRGVKVEEAGVIQAVEIQDAYSFKEEPLPRKPVRMPQMPEMVREEPDLIRKVSSRVAFNKHQWLLLSLLLAVNIIIVIILVLVVVTSF